MSYSKKNLHSALFNDDKKYTKKKTEYYQTEKFCSNCGSENHSYNNCNQPLTSYGLICFRERKLQPNTIFSKSNKEFYELDKLKEIHNNGICINNDQNSQNNQNSQNRQNSQTIQLNNQTILLNNQTINNIDNLDYYLENNLINEISNDFLYKKNDFEIVMVQRKFTIGYIEFLRGKYQTSNFKYLKKIINLMIEDERKNIIISKDFDKLRDELGMNKSNRIYRNEYEESKKKFNYLKTNGYIDELFNIDKNWEETEWGVPKGRRNDKESNLDCAIREFTEETGIDKKDLIVYQNVVPLEEIYMGINNLKYKHVYYLATIKNSEEYMNNLKVDKTNYDQYSEIKSINWFNLKESISNIRPYYTSKISIIKKAFQIINNLDIYFE